MIESCLLFICAGVFVIGVNSYMIVDALEKILEWFEKLEVEVFQEKVVNEEEDYLDGYDH